MVDDVGRRAAGWEMIPLTAEMARTYGMPDATGSVTGYRKLVYDGALVAIVGHTTNGYALAVTHVAQYDRDVVIPGRFPLFAEVYGARRVLIPDDALMVAVLEPMSFALRLRWERVHSAAMLPQTPGLPTTVKCVQMYCEGLTEDCVFGTTDVATPTPAPLVAPAPADPVGPVPDELLGDADIAALDEDWEDDDPGVD